MLKEEAVKKKTRKKAPSPFASPFAAAMFPARIPGLLLLPGLSGAVRALHVALLSIRLRLRGRLLLTTQEARRRAMPHAVAFQAGDPAEGQANGRLW